MINLKNISTTISASPCRNICPLHLHFGSRTGFICQRPDFPNAPQAIHRLPVLELYLLQNSDQTIRQYSPRKLYHSPGQMPPLRSKNFPPLPTGGIIDGAAVCPALEILRPDVSVRILCCLYFHHADSRLHRL